MNRDVVVFILLAGTVAAEEPDFSNTLYPVFQKKNCRACHTDNGIASATRLRFPELAATPGEIEEFGRGLAVLVDKDRPRESLLLKKPTNRVQHTGGKLIVPGGEEEQILVSWVERLAHLSPSPSKTAETKLASVPRLMRRLSHAEYRNTVRDLLGDQTNPASQFPEEDFVNGFKNQLEAQSIPPLLAESYSAAAERLARNPFRSANGRALIPCEPRSAEDSDCRAKFVRKFGLRAFRRPLTESEFQRYSSLFRAEATGKKDFAAGAQLVIEAMLQSPNFLFRVENASEASWKQYEIAARLSYFLWGTMPDEALFRAAAAGELGTPAAIEKAARRMIEDARARQSLDEFVAEWLRFDRVLNTVKDRRQFPQFSPELAAAMTEETRRLIADAVWKDRNFMTVFTADYAFVNSELASLYKLPAPSSEFEMVKFPTGSQRAGLLGEATFLAATSKPADTSPTARGLFVREQFLCQHIPDPPPGTNSNLPPVTEDKPMTNRQRLGVHLVRETCAGCHKLIDPIGFGLEGFDAVGGYREKFPIIFLPGRKERDQKPKTIELDLDTRGMVAGIPSSDFSSPAELGKILAATPQCQECVVKQLFRFAFGRPETPADRPIIRSSFERFRNSQFRFKELMISTAKAYASPD